MQVTRVKINLTDEGNVRAYADITLDDCFRIRELKVFRRPTGYYIAMPQVRQKDGTFREIAFATNSKTRQMIEEAVIAEYEKVAGKKKR